MRLFLPVVACLLVCGCASIRDKMIVSSPPRVRIVPAPPRVAYSAARAALDQMGFTYTHGGPAEGELEAMSQVGPGDTPGSSHQYSLKAEFRAVSGGTEVSVRMNEIIEDDTEHRPGMATTTPLRDTPLYEVFFRALTNALGSPPAG